MKTRYFDIEIHLTDGTKLHFKKAWAIFGETLIKIVEEKGSTVFLLDKLLYMETTGVD